MIIKLIQWSISLLLILCGILNPSFACKPMPIENSNWLTYDVEIVSKSLPNYLKIKKVGDSYEITSKSKLPLYLFYPANPTSGKQATRGANIPDGYRVEYKIQKNKLYSYSDYTNSNPIWQEEFKEHYRISISAEELEEKYLKIHEGAKHTFTLPVDTSKIPSSSEGKMLFMNGDKIIWVPMKISYKRNPNYNSESIKNWKNPCPY